MIRLIVFLVVGFSVFSCSGSISSEKEFIGYLKANDSVSIPLILSLKIRLLKLLILKRMFIFKLIQLLEIQLSLLLMFLKILLCLKIIMIL